MAGSLAKGFNRVAPWLVAVLLLATAWVLADRYLDTGGSGGITIVQPDDCDLNAAPCSAPHPAGGTLTLAITPRPVPMLQPLGLTLELDAAARASLGEPEALELDLAGVEMYMGFQRPRLEHTGDGRYTGETTLPICTTEAMTWAATVMPAGDPDAARVQFRFVTRRSHGETP
ncbi:MULTISPECIES: hypothetical protein [unclassified Thioalkalivibrio]|uniref:hypothetical protein n=1 Tax=unclassified Thioalkalivibrio TaxID=2621013 RepID=UPI00037DA7EE|nr:MULTISPECIES: hypothetical protein [unclassified Thioalkalivibrio]